MTASYETSIRSGKALRPDAFCYLGSVGLGKQNLVFRSSRSSFQKGYVLWLRASDEGVLEQDVIKAAEELRHELLRFDAGNDLSTIEDRRANAFYFPPVSATDPVNILKRWLKATPDGNQRILVILDDLDGLDPVHSCIKYWRDVVNHPLVGSVYAYLNIQNVVSLEQLLKIDFFFRRQIANTTNCSMSTHLNYYKF